MLAYTYHNNKSTTINNKITAIYFMMPCLGLRHHPCEICHKKKTDVMPMIKKKIVMGTSKGLVMGLPNM